MSAIDTSFAYQTYFQQLNIKRKNVKAYENIDQCSTNNAEKTTKTTTTDKTNNNKNITNESRITDTNKRSVDYSDNDKKEIIKKLNLDNASNRFSILLTMNKAELNQLLEQVDKEKLVNGLRLFDKKQLSKFIYKLPKEELLKVMLKLMPQEKLIEHFPMKALDKFLGSKKLKLNNLLNLMECLPKNILSQIIEGITGEPVGNKSESEIFSQVKSFDRAELTDGLKVMPFQEKLKFITQLTKDDPKLMMEFSQPTIFRPVENIPKGSLMESMIVLDSEKLLGMLDQLPTKYLALVASTMEADLLSYNLEKFYPELLIAAGEKMEV